MYDVIQLTVSTVTRPGRLGGRDVGALEEIRSEKSEQIACFPAFLPYFVRPRVADTADSDTALSTPYGEDSGRSSYGDSESDDEADERRSTAPGRRCWRNGKTPARAAYSIIVSTSRASETRLERDVRRSKHQRRTPGDRWRESNAKIAEPSVIACQATRRPAQRAVDHRLRRSTSVQWPSSTSEWWRGLVWIDAEDEKKVRRTSTVQLPIGLKYR